MKVFFYKISEDAKSFKTPENNGSTQMLPLLSLIPLGAWRLLFPLKSRDVDQQYREAWDSEMNSQPTAGEFSSLGCTGNSNGKSFQWYQSYNNGRPSSRLKGDCDASTCPLYRNNSYNMSKYTLVINIVTMKYYSVIRNKLLIHTLLWINSQNYTLNNNNNKKPHTKPHTKKPYTKFWNRQN